MELYVGGKSELGNGLKADPVLTSIGCGVSMLGGIRRSI
jgi:hypothetical protein